jgi:hypothetical protein
MSINKLISIKVPIYDAIAQLGIDHHKDVPFFTRLATLAEKEISSKYQFRKKIAVLDIENCCAVLPTNARYVQRAVLGDLGCDCTDLFTTLSSQIQVSSATINASSSDSSFLVVDMGTGFTQIYGSVPHVIQDNKIILNQNCDAQKLTIQYLGYEVDDEGFVKVGENHVQAIMWFIIWRYYFRKRNKNSLDYGQMNVSEREWHRECSNARAKDSELTESERAEIVSLLYDPYIGMGFDVYDNNFTL